MHSSYREFHSVYKKEWKLGFKKSGKPLPGNRHLKKARLAKCYEFSLIDRTASTSKHRHHTYSPVSTQDLTKWFKRQQGLVPSRTAPR